MDEQRKYAYRQLLYQSMLDIRPLAWLFRRPRSMLNPLTWRAQVRRVRRAGELADLMHNLALFSSLNFNHFDEEMFWEDLHQLEERYPEYGSAYRASYELSLGEFRVDDEARG